MLDDNFECENYSCHRQVSKEGVTCGFCLGNKSANNRLKAQLAALTAENALIERQSKIEVLREVLACVTDYGEGQERLMLIDPWHIKKAIKVLEAGHRQNKEAV